MTTQRDLESILRTHFDTTADRTIVDGQVERVLTRTADRRQLPVWLASLRSRSMSTTARSIGRPMPSFAWALLFILMLVVAIAAVGVGTGAWRPFGAPVQNGPLVYGRYDMDALGMVIHVADPDGSNEQVLLPGAKECPQVSPDGTRVAFAYYLAEEDRVAIGTVGIDGSDPQTLPAAPDGLQLGCASWSADGRRLAAEGWHSGDPSRNGIYLVDAADGGNVTRLTSSPDRGHDIPGDFSPDGRYLSFVRTAAGATWGMLHTVEVATEVEQQLFPNLIDTGATWSPDGRTILVDDPDSTGFLLIDVEDMRIDMEDRAVDTLQVPIDVQYVGFAQYAPDGDRLLFHAVVTGISADIYTMAIDGTDLVQVTNTPEVDEDFTDWGVALD
jgi:dipeptidyl aminopeptidase/acylaminoacyl peptidase